MDFLTVNYVIVNKLLLKRIKYTGDCEELFPLWKVKMDYLVIQIFEIIKVIPFIFRTYSL